MLENGNNKIRIAVADDHAVLRVSLRALLITQPDFEIVALTGDGEETLAALQKETPDVLVLDLFMPNGDGFHVLRQLERSGLRTASVVLTDSDNQADYAQVVRLGARGLVRKTDQPEKLFEAIRTVAGGELAFDEEVAQGVLVAMSQETQDEKSASLARLSERERQIAFLVARGMKNRDIAQELHISENTVKRHLQSIFNKTGSKDRLELAMLTLAEAEAA